MVGMAMEWNAVVVREEADVDGLAPLSSVKDISAFIGVHPRTVRNWVAAGRLRAYRTSALKGRIRIPRQAVAELLGDLRA